MKWDYNKIYYTCPNCQVLDPDTQTLEFKEDVLILHCGNCTSNRVIGFAALKEDKSK